MTNGVRNTKAVFWGFLGLFLLVSGLSPLSSQNSFARGEELFMQNRPEEALRYLRAAVAEDPAHVQAFIFLGIAYLQTDRLDDAIAAYTAILPRAGGETARVAFNLGNAHFMKGDPFLARRYFTRAIEANPSFASAYLNRANTLVRTGDLPEAVADYQMYLALQPGSQQREQITRLIAFIHEEFVAEEHRRVMAEETARIEAERRLQLLLEVSESIQTTAGGARGLSAGTEGVQDFDAEFELE
ncbi:MAG: tetratricopeptide repeat protein [Treponema sp.]|nr:tetratricopeptide repeat protein [Treponema sp.]